MHETLERFVGRYHAWRHQHPLRNPLNIPALVLVTGIVLGVYHMAISHPVSWQTGAVMALDIAFLLLYLRRSPWAWLILPVWGVALLIQLPFAIYSAVHRYPLRVMATLACLVLLMGIGFILWGLAMRGHYYAYIGHLRENALS